MSLLLILLTTISSVWCVPAKSQKIMITAPSHHAVEVGKKVFEAGGNVVDVAVAVGLTLSITSPYYGALGGGGFAMIKMGNNVQALDAREVAPNLMHSSFFANKSLEASRIGPLAVGVPGLPAGYWEMHKKYGRLKWKKLFKEPLELAKKGFRLSGDWVKITNRKKKKFNKPAKKYLFKKDGSNYLPGDLFKQPQLLNALYKYKKQGAKGFYEGAIARDIVETLSSGGGVMSLKDLSNYKVRWLKPLTASYSNYDFHFMPPPSSGGPLLKSLIELVELTKLTKKKAFTTGELHTLSEMFKIAFRTRSEYGDPDFHENPISKYTSKEYLRPLAKKIRHNRVLKMKPLKSQKDPLRESRNTTHFTVMDSEGNTVSMTITLNGNYGSGWLSKKYGIALNSEIDDFTTQPDKPNMFGLIQGRGNYVEPNKRPLSSMSPTLVTKNKQTVMALGGSGGPRIITSVFQVMYRKLFSSLDMEQSIQSPRLHHQFLPRKLFIDEWLYQPIVDSSLARKGHNTKKSWMGRVNGIYRDYDSKILSGATDRRVEGHAGGF